MTHHSSWLPKEAHQQARITLSSNACSSTNTGHGTKFHRFGSEFANAEKAPWSGHSENFEAHDCSTH
ncbi:hypothetical protein NQZ79_g4391 [Umbelopsis isabellina]|nr:hypothetical protein NQZ79_g4391 [Umbelopsis isabellina]